MKQAEQHQVDARQKRPAADAGQNLADLRIGIERREKTGDERLQPPRARRQRGPARSDVRGGHGGGAGSVGLHKNVTVGVGAIRHGRNGAGMAGKVVNVSVLDKAGSRGKSIASSTDL